MPALSIQLGTLAVLFLGSAFFSSAESALFSLNPVQLHRLRAESPTSGGRVTALLSRAPQLLSTILIGNTLVNFATVNVGFLVASRLAPRYSEALAIPVMTLLLLVLAEVAPKRLALHYAERLAGPYSRLLAPLVRWLAPLRFLMERVANRVAPGLDAPVMALTDDEFLTVVEVGEEQGVLDPEERSMVDGILRLADVQASDVMTPRVDLLGIDLSDPPEAQEKLARSVPFRHLPVYRDSPDSIEGFLDVPRFLLNPGAGLGEAIEPALFVPETAGLDDLLVTFQREKQRIACVLDEFGGTAGVITRGDILDLITEDVDNEYGVEPPDIQRIGPNRWMVEGSISLDFVNNELDTLLEADGADRIGGWVIAQAGRFLKAGESVTAQEVRATVRGVRKHRIVMVEIERLTPPADASETALPLEDA